MVKKQEKHIAPLVASLFLPGLGHILKGEIFGGVGIILVYSFSLLLCFLLIGFITTPIIWIWAAYDVYNKPAKN